MAANSDGNTELITVVTCEGDLIDPRFPAQLKVVVDKLNGILGDKVKVRKLEPWNSVRVTLSIPREAALRLRQLANEGSQQLRALGILSVQVEGDQVISLRLAAGPVNSEPQEIVLRTAQDAGSSGDRPEPPDLGLTNFLQTSVAASSAVPTTSPTIATSSQVQFKSPNVVCPVDSVVPPAAPPNSVVTGGAVTKAFAGPFPFASMNQAMHCGTSSNRELLPPPYPGGSKPQQSQPPVTISSPLLVNLLQNDGAAIVNKEAVTVGGSISRVVGMRGTSSQANFTKNIVHHTMSVGSITSPSTMSALMHPTPGSKSNVLLNTSISPSALSTNTSIRQSSSTILTSTTGSVNNVQPPQYHRALSVVKQQSLSSFQNVVVSTSTTSHSNSVSSDTTLHVQQANTLPQPCLPTQQANVCQSNPPNSLQSKSLSKQTLQQQNPVSSSQLQTNMGMSHQKLVISQKNTNLPQKNSLLTKNVTIPTQQKNVQNNILNQTFNNGKSSQLKTSFQANAISIPKSNTYMNQSVKMSPDNYTTQNSAQILSRAPTTTISNSGEVIMTNPTSLNNVILRSLPSPPPYSVAISRPWDTLVHSNSLMDLTPTLTDLKVDDLDDLLPTLELTQSPLPDLPEDFLAVHSNIISTTEEVTPPDDNRKFLINPLTGELEPQSSSESDTEEMKDVFTGLPSPAALSDEDTSSTTRPDTTTDQSDSETRLSDTNKPPRLKNSKIKDRGRDSPALKPEKIKLRLKLEKSEPINPAYKVDVSFINTQPKKASASMMTTGEELRVPPLHISLRGRNSIVIKNKTKRNDDGTPTKLKVRKSQEQVRIKKSGEESLVHSEQSLGSLNIIADEKSVDQIKAKMHNLEQKKIKKIKSTYDGKDLIASLSQDDEFKSKFVLHNHPKDKQKERRGSDSDLVRNKQRYVDNGIVSDEKKRRLSQAELDEDCRGLPVLGSTNVGTITSLPQKPRKDKVKVKDIFKKDVTKNKVFNKSLVDKLQSKVVALPTAGEMDMEAKFKQGLLEGTGDKGVPRPPHRTELVNRLNMENRIEKADKITEKTIATSIHEPPVGPTVTSLPVVDSPSLDLTERDNSDGKCGESTDKSGVGVVGVGNAAAAPGGRSPANGGGQGEDSGIESMDALSEKSPNQASQSPHADLLPPPKTQVPNMLDIEAQLAKMEGLNGDGDHLRSGSVDNGVRTSSDNNSTEGDVNENHNKIHRDHSSKLKPCCELTCVLQDNLIQGSMSLSTALTSQTLSDKQQTDINLVSLKVKKGEDDLEPLPVRVTPALYTYSNTEKSREGSESPSGLSDEDSNSCSTSSSTIQGKQSKSLLEQLLIEIPNDHQGTPSSPSPATRLSVRTRALSKLGSPELNSPISKNMKTITTTTKRKRNESDSSNHSMEDTKKKARKVVAEGLAEIKTRHNDFGKVNNLKKATKVQQEESSDSDEPLIEKVRKPISTINTQVNNAVVPKAKVKGNIGHVSISKVAIAVNTRRSVRSNMPAQNTRSKGDKINSEAEALRRKTRSAVSEVESKRKKEVK